MFTAVSPRFPMLVGAIAFTVLSVYAYTIKVPER